MTNNADPDKPTDLALHCKGRAYPGAAGEGFIFSIINVEGTH